MNRQAIVEQFTALYGAPIGAGRHRTVFRNGDWVYKVPTQSSGDFANEQEAAMDHKDYAICGIELALSQTFGVPILCMEYVRHVGWSPQADWTWGIDCGQVGLTSDGRLVAYDWDRY